MRPPAIVESFVRWQASTVPARVFETVDSTVPRSAAAVTTAIGWVRPNQAMAAAAAPTTSSASTARRGQGLRDGAFIGLGRRGRRHARRRLRGRGAPAPRRGPGREHCGAGAG